MGFDIVCQWQRTPMMLELQSSTRSCIEGVRLRLSYMPTLTSDILPVFETDDSCTFWEDISTLAQPIFLQPRP